MAKPHRGNQGASAALLAAIVACGIGVEAVSGDEPGTRIEGVVVDEAGRPVGGAGVNVTWFRQAPEDARTAADGNDRVGWHRSSVYADGSWVAGHRPRPNGWTITSGNDRPAAPRSPRSRHAIARRAGRSRSRP